MAEGEQHLCRSPRGRDIADGLRNLQAASGSSTARGRPETLVDGAEAPT